MRRAALSRVHTVYKSTVYTTVSFYKSIVERYKSSVAFYMQDVEFCTNQQFFGENFGCFLRVEQS